jgi:hypothetical protein
MERLEGRLLAIVAFVYIPGKSIRTHLGPLESTRIKGRYILFGYAHTGKLIFSLKVGAIQYVEMG